MPWRRSGVPSPPRLVPMSRPSQSWVKPESSRAAGTLLITWLAKTDTGTTCPSRAPIKNCWKLGTGGEVPDKHEKGCKGAQQGVVHRGQKLPVPEQQDHQHDPCNGRGRHQVEDPQQAQQQPAGAPDQVFPAAQRGFHLKPGHWLRSAEGHHPQQADPRKRNIGQQDAA